MNSNKMLNLHELIEPHNRKKNIKIQLFEDILGKCHSVILKYAKEHQLQYCNYSIPKFIVGKPPYNFDELKHFLIRNLNNNGFYVEDQSNRLFIAWDEAHRNLKKFNYLLEKQDTKIPKFKSNYEKPLKKPTKQENVNIGYIEYNKDDYIPVNNSRLGK
jgi:hypothetical protein